MSKKKQNIIRRGRKYKEKKTFQLVNEILSIDNKLSSQQRYINYVIQYTGSNFENVLKVLYRTPNIRNLLPTFNFDISTANSEMFFEDIDVSKTLSLLLVPIEVEIERIISLEKAKNEFEIYLFNGSLNKVSMVIDEFEKKYGTSIWSIRCQLSLLNESSEQGKIQALIQKYNEKCGSNVRNVLLTYFSLFESADSQLFLEKTIIRDNNEFIDGDALPMAASNSLLFLPYPLFDGIASFSALPFLQLYNVVDLYLYLKEIAIQSELDKYPKKDNEIDTYNLERIKNTVKSIVPQWNRKNEQRNLHLELYQIGKYLEIVNDLEEKTQEIENLIININIYAKSYIYLGLIPDKALPSLLRTTISNLMNIYNMVDVDQSLSELNSIAINNIGFDISKHIQIAIEKVLPYNSHQFKKQQTLQLTKYTFIANTPLCEELTHTAYSPNVTLAPISEREKARIKIAGNKHELSISEIEKYQDYNPLNKDYIELMAMALIQKKQYSKVLSFSVEQLLKNPESHICFPMEKISQYIADDFIVSDDAVIFCYFYSLLPGGDNVGLLNETFEEYLCDNEIQRPSEFFEKTEKISDKCFFILMHIAKTNVMDYIACFKNTSDLMFERLNILSTLKKDSRSDNNEIELELYETINELLIQNVTAKLTTSKIFVDKNRLYELNKSKITTLINQFFKLKEASSLEEPDQYFTKEYNILIELYNLMTIEYFTNTEVGLDSNLSGEIRHTFFSNLMSSKLEQRKLITELGVEGKYKSNIYWINHYSIVNAKIINPVDNRLALFSEQFHDLIERAESWMKVSPSSDNNERVFHYNSTPEEFSKLKSSLIKKTTSEEILLEIYSHIESKLEKCLNAMQIKLSNDFANLMDDLFNKLLSDLRLIRLGASLTKLISTIEQTRNDIKEDIKTVSEWFNRKNESTFTDYPIYEVIKISERCFNQGNYNEYKIKIIKNHTGIIQGEFVSRVIMALINILTNAIKYAVNKSQINIIILPYGKNGYQVHTINIISTAHRDLLLSGGLNKIQVKLQDMTSNSLLVKEGGTGLYKSKYRLIKLSDKFNIQVDIENNNFITKVLFNG